MVSTVKTLLLLRVFKVVLRIEQVLNGESSSENPEHASEASNNILT